MVRWPCGHMNNVCGDSKVCRITAFWTVAKSATFEQSALGTPTSRTCDVLLNDPKSFWPHRFWSRFFKARPPGWFVSKLHSLQFEMDMCCKTGRPGLLCDYSELPTSGPQDPSVYFELNTRDLVLQCPLFSVWLGDVFYELSTSDSQTRDLPQVCWQPVPRRSD